jgi:hypothetical protein
VIYNFSLSFLHRLWERTTETRIYMSITFTYMLQLGCHFGFPAGKFASVDIEYLMLSFAIVEDNYLNILFETFKGL